MDYYMMIAHHRWMLARWWLNTVTVRYRLYQLELLHSFGVPDATDASRNSNIAMDRLASDATFGMCQTCAPSKPYDTHVKRSLLGPSTQAAPTGGE